MLTEHLKVAEGVFGRDQFISDWSQLETAAGFLITTAVGTANLLLSEARVFVVLTRYHCAEFWPQLVIHRQSLGIESGLYDSEGYSVEVAERGELIHLSSGLINIRDIDAVRKATAQVFGALHELVARLVSEKDLREGRSIVAVSKKYERSPIVRARAVTLHGCTCCVCGLNFSDFYGAIGNGFIHIHHIDRVADYGERVIDIQNDVVPVCPNCHAMLHTRIPPLKPEQLKELLVKKGGS